MAFKVDVINFLSFPFIIPETLPNLFWISPLNIFVWLLEICQLKTEVIIDFMILVSNSFKDKFYRPTDSKKPIDFVIHKYLFLREKTALRFRNRNRLCEIVAFSQRSPLYTDMAAKFHVPGPNTMFNGFGISISLL